MAAPGRRGDGRQPEGERRERRMDGGRGTKMNRRKGRGNKRRVKGGEIEGKRKEREVIKWKGEITI